MFRFPDVLVVCGCVLGVALLATCGGDSTGPSRTPTKLAFTVQPDAVVEAGAAIRSAVQVTVQDAQGNTVTGATTNITLAITNGTEAAGATLGGTLTQAAVNGVATFGDLTVAPVGTGYTLTATATSLTSTTSTAVEVTPGVPVKLAVISQPDAVQAGAAMGAVVRVAVQNEHGITVANATTSVTLAISAATGVSGAALGGTVTVAAVAGVATFTDLSFDSAGTGFTLTASAAGLASATGSALTVSPGAAAKLAFTALPSAVVAGAAIAPAVRVTVQDAPGNTVTGSAASVTIAITGGTGADGALLGGTLTQAAVAGVATFANLTVANVGAGYTLTATATSLTSAASTAFAVTPGAASRLVYTVQPSAVVAGTAISPAVRVTVLDAQGNTVTSSTANVALAITSGTGTTGAALGGTATVAAVAGVATFANLTVAKAGTGYTLTASAAGLTGATSGALAVSPGAAAKLVFTVQPGAAVAGAAIAPAIQVTVQDAQGNTVTSATTGIIVAISSGTGTAGAVLGGTPTQDAVAGVATFADLSLDKSATGYTLTASASGLVSATSGALAVSPGPAAKLAFAVQPSAVVAGATIAPAVKVTVQDEQGNAVTSATTSIVLAITSGIGTPGAVLGGTLTQAAVAGVATFANLTLDKAGTGYTLAATAPSLTSATSNAFAVTPGAASKLAFAAQPGAVVAGAAIGPAVEVAVQDAQGNTVTSSTANAVLAITSGTGTTGALLGGTATVAAAAGVATFANLTVAKAGAGYTLTASATGLASATSTAFVVTPGPAAKLAVTVQPSAVVAGAAMSPAVQVTVQDALGNTDTSATTSVTLAITAGAGISGAVLGGTPTRAAVAGVAAFTDLSLDKAGPGYTLTARATGLTSAISSALAVSPGAAAKLVFTVQPSAVAAGAAIAPAVRVTVQDAQGNTVTSAATSITLAITTGTGTSGAVLGGTAAAAVAGVATFANLTVDRVGTGYTLTAAATGLTSAISSGFNTAAKLAITVQPNAVVVAGAVIAPAVRVTVQDAQGNTVSSATTSVTLTIAGAGGAALGGTLTKAAEAGVATFANLTLDKVGIDYTITATASGLTDATSSLFNVTPGAAAKLAVTVQPSAVVAGAAITPAVVVAVQDASGNLVTAVSGTVSLALTTPGGATLTGGGAATVTSGVATFGGLSVNKAGTVYTLTATATNLTSATSTSFVVTPGAAAKLAFTVQPSAVVAEVAISPAVQVTVQDASGNLVTAESGTVTLALTSADGATLTGGGVPVAVSSGVATFGGLSVNKVGSYTLTPTTTVAGVTTLPASSSFAVSPGTGVRLVFTQQPSAVVAGVAIGPAVKVTVLDVQGNTVTSATNNIALAITGGTGTTGATLAGTPTVASAGVATFANLTVNQAGTGYTLTAAATSLTGATSTAFNVAPVLAFTVQPSTSIAGAVIAPSVVVTIRDAQGNTVTSATTSVTLAITNSTGTSGALLGGALTQVAVAGVATFPDLTLDKVGTGYMLTATATSPSSATSTAFGVIPGAASKLAFTAMPSTVKAGVPLSPPVLVTVQDANGNVVTAASGTVSLALTTPGGATLTGGGAVAVSGGLATFSDLKIDSVGSGYTLTATSAGLASAISDAVAVTTPMTVSDVNPTNGATAGATPVTITGTNFVNVTGVTIGGVALGSLIVVSSTQITGVSPASVSFGAKDVVVTSSTFGTVTCVGCFTYNPWEPIVAAGLEQSCGLTMGGAAYCWGSNASGQLGDGSTSTRTSPAAVSGDHVFQSISAGDSLTCGLTTGGVAYCWGSNTYGQLGDGTTSGRTSPVVVAAPASGAVVFQAISAGYAHSCGLTTGGAVYCWGRNDAGQLGNGTAANSSIPVLVPGIPAFQAISAGAVHTCGLTTAGAAFCWGWNAYGQLGNNGTSGSSIPVSVSGAISFSSLTAGWGHTCGLTAGGDAYCWGWNAYGQLGDGSIINRTSPVLVSSGLTKFASLTAGWGHTCGLTSDGAVYCWGRNDVGQLGNGTTSQRTSPVLVSGNLVFDAISSGGYHSCGITALPGRAAHCWGYNLYGQLGDGTSANRLTPVAVLSP